MAHINSKALTAFMRGLTGNSSIVHEHTSFPSFNELEKDVQLYLQLGYTLLFSNETTAFLERLGRHRIEISHPSVPEHQAWACPSQNEWAEVHNFLMGFLGPKSRLQDHVIQTDALHASMFRLEDGSHIQLIWRKEQMFTDVFV